MIVDSLEKASAYQTPNREKTQNSSTHRGTYGILQGSSELSAYSIHLPRFTSIRNYCWEITLSIHFHLMQPLMQKEALTPIGDGATVGQSQYLNGFKYNNFKEYKFVK